MHKFSHGQHFSVVSLLFFSTLWALPGAAVEVHDLLDNCESMNHIAWNDYERSLLGQPITGSGNLENILANYGSPGSPIEKMMNLFGVEPSFTLIFKGSLEINIRGFDKSSVINLKIGNTYVYSASKILSISHLDDRQCDLAIEAEN